MAGHRYRINKIKRMHSIIHGLLPVLEAMAAHPAIAQITPGRISANRRAGDRNITLQYYTDSGFKLLARNPSSIQEVFVVTSEPEEVHKWLLQRQLIQETRSEEKAAERPERPAPAANSNRTQKRRRANLVDYPVEPDVPITLDAPSDALTLSDHLESDVVGKLQQLRQQAAAREQAKAQPSARAKAKANGRPPAQAQGAAATKTETNKTAEKKPLNPLEAWLAEADDETFRRLSNKFKGGNR